MKYLDNIRLKQLAIGLLGTFSSIVGAEYLILRTKIQALEDVDQKKDFVRKAQFKSQEISFHLHSYLQDKKELSASITSNIAHYEHLLKTLAQGGRVDQSEIFIKPLSRLPKITFDNLYENWLGYKENALIVLIEPDAINVETTQHVIQNHAVSLDSVHRDSIQQPIVTTTSAVNAKVVKARALLAGQWLSLANWHDKLIIDLQEEEHEKDQSLNTWFIVMVMFDLGLLYGIYALFAKFILHTIQTLETNTVAKAYTLDLPNNEIGSLAQQINYSLEQLKDATDFVTKISEGNLEIDYRELDGNYSVGKNKLADSLVLMQAKLKSLNEEEQKRQWSNEGLAKFVDILRSSNDNINALGDNIISALVHYTNSNQGGLYILNDEEETNQHLELISLFAFENKKFERQRVKFGEGILGQSFLEKQTTYLTEIPEDYVRINSGLGEAPPKAILIVPLKVDRKVYGIVELATFKQYRAHEIAFVEKLGETIASTLASVKSAQHNRHLIEQFQQQTEEMRAQEEEMRQNMEELQATQEEMARKERNYVDRITKYESQAASSHSEQDFINLRDELTRKERDYQHKINEIELKLSQKSAHGNDWALAEEVEKTLKISLEAIKITQQEFERKTGKV